MDLSLAIKLIDKNLINGTTEVTARYKTVSVGGNVNLTATEVFTVARITTRTDNNILLEATSTRKGERRTLSVLDIIEIDGMEPNRFASVYDIKADGSNAAVGKRRGRKPKVRAAI